MKLKNKFLVLLLAVVFAFTLFAMAACGDDEDDKKDEVSIHLSETSITLVAGGDHKDITASVKGTTAAVEWSIDKTDVATIQYEGITCRITPVAEGMATVTAKVGGKQQTCSVTVDPAPKPAVKITLDKAELSLTKGDQATLVTATLENAEEGATVTWLLGNGGDATVNITPNGNKVSVLPIAVGTTTLTAKLGEVEKTIDVTVTKAPVSLTLDKENVDLDTDEGDDQKLTETVKATVANNDGELEWSIGNDKIATIEVDEQDNTLVTVTAVAVGKTTLTAKVDGVEETIDVTVSGTPVGDVEIELSETQAQELTVGDELKLTVAVINSLDTPKWTVDGDAVTLSAETGTTVTLTAAKEGEVTLTVSVGEDEDVTKVTLTITVWEPASLELDKTEVILFNDPEDDQYSAQVEATVAGKIKVATWEIVSGEEYITLTGDDTNTVTVTAKAAGGTAVVKAYIGEGESKIEKQFTVTVKAPLTLTLDKETLNLTALGADGTITATVEGAEDGEELTYKTDKDDIVEITKNDNVLTVKPLKAGTVVITVEIGGKEVECTVEVEALPEIVFTSTATFGEESGFIWHKGEYTSDLISQASTMDVVVKVNGNVVTPNDTQILAGVVNVQIVGTGFDDVEIEYTFKNDGVIVATAALEYKGIKEIVLDSPAVVKIKVGETGEITATVNGNIADKTVTWSIVDTEGTTVATLPETKTGNTIVVTAASAGKATLTATVGSGESAIIATCEIQVSADELPPVVSVDVTSGITKQEVYNVQYVQLWWNLDGIDGFDASSVSDYTVSGVKNGNEYAVKVQSRVGATAGNVVGTGTQINMNAAPSGSTLTITVHFLNAADEEIGYATVNVEAPKTMTLNKYTLPLTLSTDNTPVTETISVTVSDNVTEEIEWSIVCDVEGCVTMSVAEDKKSATITAVKIGTATITVQAGADLKRNCTVTVQDPSQGGDDDDNKYEAITLVLKGSAPYAPEFFDFDLYNDDEPSGITYAILKDSYSYYTITVKGSDANIAGGHKNMYVFGPESDNHWRIQIQNTAQWQQGTTYDIKFYDSSDTLIAVATYTYA